MAGKNGGARPGAGRKPGGKNQATIDKELQREVARQLIAARLEPIIEAQCDNATGIKHFMLRDAKTGQFRRLTDPDEIVQALNAGGEGTSYYIYSKDPSAQSAADMLNRLLDKPKEQEQSVEHSGTFVFRHEMGE